MRQNNARGAGAESDACGSVVNRSGDDVIHMGSLVGKMTISGRFDCRQIFSKISLILMLTNC